MSKHEDRLNHLQHIFDLTNNRPNARNHLNNWIIDLSRIVIVDLEQNMVDFIQAHGQTTFFSTIISNHGMFLSIQFESDQELRYLLIDVTEEFMNILIEDNVIAYQSTKNQQKEFILNEQAMDDIRNRWDEFLQNQI